jgi:FkbM family methyltransferase
MLLSLRDLPFRLKRKLYKITRTRHVRTRYGVLMRANWRDATFRMCQDGSYGTALSDLLAQRKNIFLFLDIGANQGLYSLLAARNPNCQQAFAFEPVSQTYNLLCDNIAANGLTASVTPIHAAVSDADGTAEIHLHIAHSGAASLSTRTLLQESNVETIRTIDIFSIDDLIGDDGEILVKIDVEGHEDVVIGQLMASRHRARMAAIFYEVDERWSNPAALEAALRAAGFATFIRHGSGTHYDMLALRDPADAN